MSYEEFLAKHPELQDEPTTVKQAAYAEYLDCIEANMEE